LLVESNNTLRRKKIQRDRGRRSPDGFSFLQFILFDA
jgi:hypothetical protein